MMQRTAYFVALAVVGVSVFASVAITTAAWSGIYLRFGALPTLVGLFASPLPAQLQFLLPAVVQFALSFGFAALVARRLWLLAHTKPVAPPPSLGRWPGRLLLVAVTSLALMVAGLMLSIAARAGSGVPAGLLGLPAAVLLAPVLFYVELRSLPWFSPQVNGT